MSAPNAQAKTIQIFLPNGEPRGIRIAELTTRIVQAVLIPRSDLAGVRPAISQHQRAVLDLAHRLVGRQAINHHHVRRDFIGVGKAWPELKDWALAWLRRIRDLYRLHSEGLRARDPADGPAANLVNPALRQHRDIMHEQAVAECAEPTLRQPCRKVLQSLQEHWPGLTRFLDDPRIPLDNNASERQLRGPVVGRKNYYGSGAIWSGRLAAMLFSLFATLQQCQ